MRTNDTGMTRVPNTTSEIDKDSEGNHEEEGSSHDEGLQLANLHDDEAENNTCDNGNKTVKRCDPCSAENGFVKAHVEHRVKEISLQVPR